MLDTAFQNETSPAARARKRTTNRTEEFEGLLKLAVAHVLCELQPLGHQIPFIYFEAGRAIQRLCRPVFSADFETQRLDAIFSAQIFSKRDYRLS